jgi:transglutaminase-like putative cysteine protease
MGAGSIVTIFSVRHITDYRYKRPVKLGEHRLMFRPRDSFDQTLLNVSLVVEPAYEQIRWIHDPFGNCVALVSFSKEARSLRFESNIRLDHTPHAALDFPIDQAAIDYPFAYDAEELPDLAPTMARHFADPADLLGAFARQFVHSRQPTRTSSLLMGLCYMIHDSFAYVRRSEHGVQAPLETLELKTGTCRDFALLMMEAARALGLAARFVTGYIYVPSRDGSTTLGGGSTHAWCQIYIPGAGWVEFDPTNGIVGNRDLIRVGVARDPRQAVPLSGSYDGRASDFKSLTVQVNVTSDGDEAAPP